MISGMTMMLSRKGYEDIEKKHEFHFQYTTQFDKNEYIQYMTVS